MWCVLIAVGAGYLAKKRWKSHESSLTLPLVKEGVEAYPDIHVQNGAEGIIPSIRDDSLPVIGEFMGFKHGYSIHTDAALHPGYDADELSNAGSVFIFTSKRNARTEKGIARTSQKKETIRSKIAQKGWEKYEGRLQRWPRCTREKFSKATASGERAPQILLRVPHDKKRSAAEEDSLLSEAEIKISPSEKKDCRSYTLQERAICRSFPLLKEGNDPSVQCVSTSCASDVKRKACGCDSPGLPVEVTNTGTFDKESPKYLSYIVADNAKHKEAERVLCKETSDLEEFVEQQRNIEYEKDKHQGSAKELIQTLPWRTPGQKEESLDTSHNIGSICVQDIEGWQQAHSAHRLSRIRKREMEERGDDSRLELTRTSANKAYHFQASYIPALTRPTEYSTKDNRLKVCEVRNAEAFPVGYGQDVGSGVKVKEMRYGSSTEGQNSQASFILDITDSVSKVMLDCTHKPEILPVHNKMSNEEKSAPIGKNFYLPQKGQLLSMKGALPGKFLLPMFLKKRKINECLESITPLQTFVNMQPSEVTMPSNSVFLITVGLGIGLLFTWTSCQDEIRSLQSLLTREKIDAQLKNSRKDVSPAQMVFRGNINSKHLKLDVRKELDPVFLSKAEIPAPYCSSSGTDQQDVAEEELNDDECSKSVLTEDHLQKEDTLAKLEAELEAELELMETNLMDSASKGGQSGCLANDMLDQENTRNLSRGEFSDNGFPIAPDLENKNNHAKVNFDRNSHPVSPRELEHRLRVVLEERQEEEISRLQTQLHITEQRLQAKEAEFREWKQQVRRLIDFSLKSADGDFVDIAPRTETTKNPCTKDALDVSAKTQTVLNLYKSPKQHEILTSPLSTSHELICSFGHSLGCSKQIGVSSDHHDINVRQAVGEEELLPLIKHEDSDCFLHHIGKSFIDEPSIEAILDQRTNGGPIKISDATQTSFDGFEYDSDSSCISTCSATFSSCFDALVVPSGQKQPYENLEKPDKQFLRLERMEFSYLEPVRNPAKAVKTSRSVRKLRKKN